MKRRLEREDWRGREWIEEKKESRTGEERTDEERTGGEETIEIREEENKGLIRRGT